MSPKGPPLTDRLGVVTSIYLADALLVYLGLPPAAQAEAAAAARAMAEFDQLDHGPEAVAASRRLNELLRKT